MSISLSDVARRAVRAAVTSHPNWKAWRNANGKTAADLRAAELIDLAKQWSIDVEGIARKADRDAEIAAEAEKRAERERDFDMVERRDDAASVKPEPVIDANDAANAMQNALAGMAQIFMPIIEQKVRQAIENMPEKEVVHKILVKRENGLEWKSDGSEHPLFRRLLTMLTAKMANGYVSPVWIAGPTGSGKTHAAHQAATALGLPFYFNGALAMSHELVGFVDAGGTYHTTPFRQAYEHGGVYLFDEVDASDNSALLALNAALANGSATFPDSPVPVKRHADFRCIGAGNTFGQGATAEFIGRAKIDAAFLSRFANKIFWTYDIALEQNISGNPAFAKRVQAARARAQAAGVKIVIDPRHSMAGAALIAAGMSEDEAAECTYLAGLKPEQVKLVEGK